MNPDQQKEAGLFVIPLCVEGKPLSLAQIETIAIGHAIDLADGNMTRAARMLGIGRSTLYRKIKDLKEDAYVQAI